MTTADLLTAIRSQPFSFLAPSQVAALAEIDAYRLTPILVRLGACRFTAPAQDVANIVGAIVERNGDYVRDYSLPAGVKL